MTSTTSPPADGSTLDFQSLPVISRVEGDRFCDGCGYNLNKQAIRREPATGVPLCRCPECGMFHAAGDMSTAGRLWLYRAGRILLVVWVFVAWSAAVAVMMTQIMLTIGVLDVLRPMLISTTPEQHPLAAKWPQLVGFACVLSAILGMGTITACAMVFTHWKTWSYGVAALIWPVVSAILLWFHLSFVARTPQASLMAIYTMGLIPIVAYFGGGLIGVFVGRRTARLTVRWLIPPVLWGVFSYLWTADGLTPPTPRDQQ